MSDVRARFEAMDVEIARRLAIWKQKGMPTPCLGCVETHCCKQFVLAFEDECQYIATTLGEHQVKVLAVWAWKFLDLPAEVQRDEISYFDANLPCPFLEEGRCSIYAARPGACRTHHSLDDASPGACHGEAKTLRYLDGMPILRMFPPDDYINASPMALRVAALVCKGRLSRLAAKLAKTIADERLNTMLEALRQNPNYLNGGRT